MDSMEKYEYWLDIAEYDLSTARANYKSRRYLYVVFMCQQSIEKIVKGLYVLYTNSEADRTHNIATERYPSYKEKLSTSITKNKAKEVLDEAEEAFVWLKSLRQYKT